MLYETLLQGLMFLCFLWFGIVCGFFLSGIKLLEKIFKHKKIAVVVFDIAFMIVFSLLFVFAKTIICYGEFRIFEVLRFCLGIFLEQISLNNLVEKFLNLSYTLLGKVFAKLKHTKLFAKIFK